MIYHENSVLIKLGKGAIYSLMLLEDGMGVPKQHIFDHLKRYRKAGKVRYQRLTRDLIYICYLKETDYDSAEL